jgi:hypothetical protein
MGLKLFDNLVVKVDGIFVKVSLSAVAAVVQSLAAGRDVVNSTFDD